MTDWKEQYLAALEARDQVEKANVDLYNYCSAPHVLVLKSMLTGIGTKLADEKAALIKEVAEKKEQSSAPSPPQPLIGYGIPRFTSPVPVSDTGITSQLRVDLSKAQREREVLQNRLDTGSRELESLKARAGTDAKQIRQLSASVSQLTRKLRDREEELRGKAKLVENVQDENVTLNLQLNVAEDKASKLVEENQELVDRWMALKGDEARKMNEAGKFA